MKRDLGETYRAGRGYTHSLFVLNEALKFFTLANDTVEIAKTYNRLAATQFELLPSYPHYQIYIERMRKTRNKFQEVLRSFPELKGGFDTLDLYCGKAMSLSRKKKPHSLHTKKFSDLKLPLDHIGGPSQTAAERHEHERLREQLTAVSKSKNLFFVIGEKKERERKRV